MELMRRCLAILSVLTLTVADEYYDDDYQEDSDENVNYVSCDPRSNCLLPNCSCFGTIPLNGDGQRLPQFVMVTFDDAVTTLNIKTYREIADKRNNSNGCPLTMTFFATHEYNDYEFVNELYKKGHEIAVHSITHESSTEMWKHATVDRWRNEMVGMRHILSKFGLIPNSEIRGHRAPFLQTAGDETFQMLKDSGFAFDSSMPTRTFMEPPLWPYTLDYGFRQDCQIQPCPKSKFPGLWVFPMVQWERISKQGNQLITFHCSMLDACTPYPTNVSDTYAYMMENFDRHYTSNRAPFPIFLHEAWLRDKNRLKGFQVFLDALLQKDDVFLVSMHEVLEYMKKPVPLEEYKTARSCLSGSRPQAGDCKARVCNYPKRNILMKSCVPCPKRYPWLGNPEGAIKPTKQI